MKEKHGTKYVLVTADGIYGPDVVYFDSLRKLGKRYKDMVKESRASIWTAYGDRIYRVGLNGRLPEGIRDKYEFDHSDPRPWAK